METKQLFEDVLSGKLKGTFVLRNGDSIKSNLLERSSSGSYPYAFILRCYLYTSTGFADRLNPQNCNYDINCNYNPNVSIISDVQTDKVSIGNTVSIKYVDDDEEDEYKIVGSQEADPFESKISNESPIAQALFDHKVGDIVTVESPNGSYEVEIISIE